MQDLLAVDEVERAEARQIAEQVAVVAPRRSAAGEVLACHVRGGQVDARRSPPARARAARAAPSRGRCRSRRRGCGVGRPGSCGAPPACPSRCGSRIQRWMSEPGVSVVPEREVRVLVPLVVEAAGGVDACAVEDRRCAIMPLSLAHRRLRQPRQQRVHRDQGAAAARARRRARPRPRGSPRHERSARWEDLELELPTDRLGDAAALPDHPLPDWVLANPIPHDRARHAARLAAAAPGATRRLRLAARAAGGWGALIVLDRAWVVRTLARYDCVIAYGMGPAWAAIADVPCVAMTWGGDITMVPFYDTGDWEGHVELPLPGPPRELFAQARLQRLGYEHAGRILLTDPRFASFAERLGHTGRPSRSASISTRSGTPRGPEPELRRELLGDDDGLIVFMPSRQTGSGRAPTGCCGGSRKRAKGITPCSSARAGAPTSTARGELITELGIATACGCCRTRCRRRACGATTGPQTSSPTSSPSARTAARRLRR